MQQIVPGLYAAVGTVGENGNEGIAVAAFDLDWTIIRSVRGRFHKSADDWAILPNRISTLRGYKEMGYTIAIFTNQGYKGAKLATALNRVSNIAGKMNTEGISPWILVSTEKDVYRKPSIGMWQVLEKSVGKIDRSRTFYCGDAAGRASDFSSDDISFASNVGISFYTPEQIFPRNEITIPNTQTMFIFVGMPGSGKTTYYTQELQHRGWVHVNQDTLKTRNKVLGATRNALQSGRSVAIDATNPDPGKRRDFVNMAIELRIPTLIVYFVRNGYEINKTRPSPVPDIAYNMYYKNLVEPDQSIDLVPVVEIM